MRRGAIIIEGGVLRKNTGEGVIVLGEKLAFLETNNVIFGKGSEDGVNGTTSGRGVGVFRVSTERGTVEGDVGEGREVERGGVGGRCVDAVRKSGLEKRMARGAEGITSIRSIRGRSIISSSGSSICSGGSTSSSGSSISGRGGVGNISSINGSIGGSSGSSVGSSSGNSVG